jgi:hypothetical protein
MMNAHRANPSDTIGSSNVSAVLGASNPAFKRAQGRDISGPSAYEH